MQVDHNAHGGPRASVSRRNFLQMSLAGVAVTIPTTSLAVSTTMLSSNEADLIDAVNQHAIVSGSIKRCAAFMTELEARPDKPVFYVTVREVATRASDYPSEGLDVRMHSKLDIQRYFGHHLAVIIPSFMHI